MWIYIGFLGDSSQIVFLPHSHCFCSFMFVIPSPMLSSQSIVFSQTNKGCSKSHFLTRSVVHMVCKGCTFSMLSVYPLLYFLIIFTDICTLAVDKWSSLNNAQMEHSMHDHTPTHKNTFHTFCSSETIVLIKNTNINPLMTYDKCYNLWKMFLFSSAKTSPITDDFPCQPWKHKSIYFPS